MEHAVEAHGLSGLDAEGDYVFYLEVDRVPDTDAVADAAFNDLERRSLHAEHLADERG